MGFKYYSYKNDDGFKKCSPSSILNYYYPFPNIEKKYLEIGGKRGSCLHDSIEEFIATKNNILEIKINEYNQELIKNGFEFSENDIIGIKQSYDNFINNYDRLEIEKNNTTEFYIDKLEKIHGFIDYFDGSKIIDWKTNSSVGKKEIEKYGLQMNLYRYMIYKQLGISLPSLKIVHITKNEELTPGFKIRKPEQLVKIHEIELLDFDYLEQIIDEVYKKINNLGEIC